MYPKSLRLSESENRVRKYKVFQLIIHIIGLNNNDKL